MRNLFLSLLLLSPWCYSKPGVVKSKFNYTMSLYYETNLITDKCRSIAFINGKQLTCVCGGEPILIMIVYGHVQGFCVNHIPYVDSNTGHDCKCKEQDEH